MARTTNEKVHTHLQAALESLEREKSQIDDQIRAIRSVLGSSAPAAATKGAAAAEAKPDAEPVVRRRRRRKLSAEARARIAAAQKKRWADFRKGKD